MTVSYSKIDVFQKISKMNYLISLIILFTTGSSFCQSDGYFKRKNLISLNGVGAIPLLYNLLSSRNEFEHMYKNQNGNLVQANSPFSGGCKVGLVHYSSPRVGYGIDVGLNFSKSRGPRELNSIDIKHEMLSISTLSIVPKLEFSTQHSMLPVGFHSQFGIGYERSKIVPKDYLIIAESYENDLEYDPNKVFDPNIRAHGITFMFEFNVRVPITKRLMLNYGVRYNYNHTFGADNWLDDVVAEFQEYKFVKESSKAYIFPTSTRRFISDSRMTSIMTLNLGLNFAF